MTGICFLDGIRDQESDCLDRELVELGRAFVIFHCYKLSCNSVCLGSQQGKSKIQSDAFLFKFFIAREGMKNEPYWQLEWCVMTF